MKSPRSLLLRACCILTLAPAMATLTPIAASAADRQKAPANRAGAPVRGENGEPINYDRETLEAMMQAAAPTANSEAPVAAQPNGFVPSTPGAQQPFWQYAIFGSGIGASNIVLAPAPSGVAPDIIVGGNSGSGYGGDDFWQVIRWNAATSTYEQLFVSPVYTSAVKRIALGNVMGDANLEIAVMLADGRIYLYNLQTRTELGYLTTTNGLEGLSLTDFDGNGVVEVVVTSANDLFVYNGAGSLLWQLAGAGGLDVVVGQMDNDPALEIAATKGHVVDAATHTIQWTRNGGFGARLRLAPFPGESYQQLIVAEAWYYVYSYDVRRQLPRWSINADLDINGLRIADVENDGMPEVLVGDGQWGSVHVYDLLTRAHKWEAQNPEHGVTDIAVGDADGDGVLDLLWGAGWSSSGADYLYVASTTGNHAIKWQSLDLQGPFVGPAIGDLDGDNKPELVFASVSSDSGYDSGRILVFDLATLAFRGISAPVINNRNWEGLRDLKLRDIEGDGPLEIVIAGDDLYDGVIEIYGFSAANTFTKKWANTTKPAGSPFNFVEVADLDGNGSREVIAGNTVAHTGSEGVYIYIFDYPATTNPWRSVNLTGGFREVTGLVVQDLDTIGGSKEIAALVTTGDLYTFDGPTRQLRDLRQSTGATLLSNRATPFGLVAADNAGLGRFLHYGDEDYTERFSRQLASGALSGISVLPNGTLWTGSGGTLRLRRPPLYNTVAWETPAFGPSFGRFVAREVRNGEERIFSSARHAVVGLIAPHDFVSVITATSRKGHGVGALDTSLPLAGLLGVESRSGGPNGDHTIVFTFNNDVVSGTAVTSGPGTISGLPAFADNTMTVNLTGVPDAQTVTITLMNVSDNFGQVLGEFSFTAGFLVGDTNGDRVVNAGDALQTRNRSGQAVTWANCRSDVNRDGTVNGGDALLVKSRSGQSLQ